MVGQLIEPGFHAPVTLSQLLLDALLHLHKALHLLGAELPVFRGCISGLSQHTLIQGDDLPKVVDQRLGWTNQECVGGPACQG